MCFDTNNNASEVYELEPGCRHVRCHHKNEAIVKKGQNNINVLGANE